MIFVIYLLGSLLNLMLTKILINMSFYVLTKAMLRTAYRCEKDPTGELNRQEEDVLLLEIIQSYTLFLLSFNVLS